MTIDDGVTVYDRAPRRRRGERPAPRPLDALDSHVAVVDALASPDGAGIIESATADGQTGVRETDTKRVNDQRFARALSDQLNTATTLVVTDRMLEFVLDRMASIPFGDPLRPDDLLFESAYIVLSRPVTVGDLGDDDYGDVFPPRRFAQFDAGFYVPMGVATYDALRKAEVTADGILYAQCASIPTLERVFADLVVPGGRFVRDRDGGLSIVSAESIDVTQDGLHLRAGEIMHAMQRLYAMRLKHVPVYSSGIGFGVSWDPELREEDFVLTPAGEFERRFWLSLLRTIVEEVFAPVRFRRADYRRAARAGIIPDVVVADLRRVKHTAKEETLPGGETIMWSHRWMRSGHPRTIHKGTEKERTIWVREHVCGPKSMPLILKDRVHRLSR